MTTLLNILLTALTAQAWLTAPGNGINFAEQELQLLSSGTAEAQCLTIDPNTEYQTVDGFGWMLNEGSAKLLKGMHSKLRADFLKEIYSVEEGLGVSVIRIAIGASDLSESDYTYCDVKDETLASFSLAGPDSTYLIPVLKEILAINPNVKIMAVPWTAPTWMKTGTGGHNGFMGGTLRTEYYDLYAEYFLRYLQAMQAEGFTIWAISPQNEPLHGGNNPSMTFTKETEYKFINNYLGPKLAQNGFAHVKIICYDHNCDNIDFPRYVAQSQYVSGSAFHLYGGNISALTQCHSLTGKDVYFTEQYTGDGDLGGDYSWHMQNVMIGSMQNWSRCAIEWNLASDPSFGPHTDGGCTTCKGGVTISGGKVTGHNASYYIVGTMSKVVRTGARRIGSTGAGDFKSVAFRNADGSLAVVAYNKSGANRKLSIKFGTDFVTYTVPRDGCVSILIPEATAPLANPVYTKVSNAHKELRNGQLLLSCNNHVYSILGMLK